MHTRVLLSEPVGLLDYRIPEELEGRLRPGVPVKVPLGNRHTDAYVAQLAEDPPAQGIALRDIQQLDEDRPILPEPIIELVLFAADYYCVPPGEVLAAALPAVARPSSRRFCITHLGRYELEGPNLRPLDRQLLELAARFPRGLSATAVSRDLGWTRSATSARLKRQVERGWLSRVFQRRGPRAVIAYQRTGSDPGVLGTRQEGARQLLELIPRSDTIVAAALARRDKNAYTRLKALEKAGLVRRVLEEQRRQPRYQIPERDRPPIPTSDQAAAIDAITQSVEGGVFQTFLLQGVTGSGKTEVYLRVIERALERGRTALVLVPEIALTPQLGSCFRARFGDQVATFHSALTPAERRDEWERVARGERSIGLGARSAVFLPLMRVGVVIVDEEYETSFKQEESPRYNARDLAVVRGRLEKATVVLGSATPSLESRANAAAGRYVRLVMPSRVLTRPLPTVHTISLAAEERVGQGVFTAPLAEMLDRTLASGDQAVLFLNRRGYAPYVFCRDCGHAFRCPDCDVALTLHRHRQALLCHYCGFEEVAPDLCPACLGHRVISHGLGTERVEGEIRALFGGVPTARLDRDTVRRSVDLDRQLERFASGEARILIGTQMVAKGHDFPRVTLVGVIGADASLNFPDFRAAERTFQLLTQVAGRAGRGERPGSVWIQAYETEHYAIKAAAAHDYETFVKQELVTRRELRYPPYSHLALVRFEGESEDDAQQAAAKMACELRDRTVGQSARVQVLGPAQAPLSRLRGVWRFQVLLKAPTRRDLRTSVAVLSRRPAKRVRQILDVDPFSML
jgi:primosomal protein N' (replication factor Y)